jgi:hypothetical protein
MRRPKVEALDRRRGHRRGLPRPTGADRVATWQPEASGASGSVFGEVGATGDSGCKRCRAHFKVENVND